MKPETTAMVLAAGLGTRMRPLTDATPKPLIRVAGKPLIDYALETLEEAGIARAVVNVHHHAGQIRAHLDARGGIETAISDETAGLLDSGGGIVRALPLLGDGPFLVLNADTFWIDAANAPVPNLTALIDGFDPETMDIRLMVADPAHATGHTGSGDFVRDDAGRVRRFADAPGGHATIYAGALVCHPRVFADAPAGAFSLNRCFDRAIAARRLFSMPMHGHWLTVGTPDAIADAERAMAGLSIAARGRTG